MADLHDRMVDTLVLFAVRIVTYTPPGDCEGQDVKQCYGLFAEIIGECRLYSRLMLLICRCYCFNIITILTVARNT
jgi:hypothetical protein